MRMVVVGSGTERAARYRRVDLWNIHVNSLDVSVVVVFSVSGV